MMTPDPHAPDVWSVGPANGQLNITNGCNLACSHCHASSGTKLDGELSTTEMKRVLNELHRLGVMNLAIAGGEPFMRRDVLDILEHACALPGWQVAVITNGMFFASPGRLAELADRCPGITVNVSLDGSTPSRFHVLRRQAHRPDADPAPMFATVKQAISDLVAAGVTTAVNFTLTRSSLQDCVPTYRVAVQELGASALVAIKFFPGGYGKAIADLLDISYLEWSPMFTDLTRRRLVGELPALQISVPAAWEFYLPLIDAGIEIIAAEQAWGYRSPLREAAYSSRVVIGDPAGVAELCVDADGTVYPSVLLGGVSDVACGNVRLAALDEIWRTSAVLVGMRSLQLAGLASNCRSCPARRLCGGGSRARALSLTGHLSGADTVCPIITPAPCNAPQFAAHAASSWASPAHMRVVGSGRDAARIFRTANGTQIRVGGRIISCGPETSVRLDALLESAVAASGPDLMALLNSDSSAAG